MEIRTFKTFAFHTTPEDKEAMEKVNEMMKAIVYMMEEEEIWSFIKDETGECFDLDDVMRIRGVLSGLVEKGNWKILE
jgi:hypothetical protein